ncbi:MAG TPA: hypothetical protein VLJ76_07255 [Gaiellaceae bacterium]|nr:hypothetical protein [Gaiellaceae bacterium]
MSGRCVQVDGPQVEVWRQYPYHGRDLIIRFSTETLTYEKHVARIDSELSSQT